MNTTNDPINFIDSSGEVSEGVITMSAGIVVTAVGVGTGNVGLTVAGVSCMVAAKKMINQERKKQLEKELNDAARAREIENNRWNGL